LSKEAPSRRRTALAALGFSLLNPHVYLDTVILLGGIGARHPAVQRPGFIAGASSASLLWFFGLAFGAALLTPLFHKPVTWRILDVLIGCVMWLIAARLVWP
jgi:L-lysine exporter family protein LysE/ArgO